jgi:hypothetical protein
MLVFDIRWPHARLWVAGGVVLATLLDTIGGTFDRSASTTSAPMWTQVAGFFVLDEMLVVVIIAFGIDWFARTTPSRQLSFVVGWLASISMFIAAIMGHIAGWILDFGAHPWFVASYAKFVGEKVTDLQANMTGSHSHEMVVAFMCFVVASGVAFFAGGVPAARGAVLRRIGLTMAAVSLVIFTAVYVAAGFTSWVIPTWFQSAHGTNGLASDDLATGLGMIGGFVALLSLVVGRVTRPLLPAVAAAWSWLMMVGLVVATGYWIELHEVAFSSGGKAGQMSDAIFTWFHQDIGLFLFPLMTAVMIVTARLVLPKRQDTIALAAIAGTTLLFAAGMVYLFADQAIRGPGYVLATIGLLVTAGTFLSSIWWGLVVRLLPAGLRPSQVLRTVEGAVREPELVPVPLLLEADGAAGERERV